MNAIGELGRVNHEKPHTSVAVPKTREDARDIRAEVIVSRMAHDLAVDVDRDGRTVNRNDVRLWRNYPAKVYVVRAGNRFPLSRCINRAKGKNRAGIVYRDRGNAEIG